MLARRVLPRLLPLARASPVRRARRVAAAAAASSRPPRASLRRKRVAAADAEDELELASSELPYDDDDAADARSHARRMRATREKNDDPRSYALAREDEERWAEAAERVVAWDEDSFSLSLTGDGGGASKPRAAADDRATTPPFARRWRRDDESAASRLAAYMRATGRLSKTAPLEDAVAATFFSSDACATPRRARCRATLTTLDGERRVEDGRWAATEDDAKEDAMRALLAWMTMRDSTGVRPIHWFPYARVGAVNADT
jgi:hypothetical protein